MTTNSRPASLTGYISLFVPQLHARLNSQKDSTLRVESDFSDEQLEANRLELKSMQIGASSNLAKRRGSYLGGSTKTLGPSLRVRRFRSLPASGSHCIWRVVVPVRLHMKFLEIGVLGEYPVSLLPRPSRIRIRLPEGQRALQLCVQQLRRRLDSSKTRFRGSEIFQAHPQ